MKYKLLLRLCLYLFGAFVLLSGNPAPAQTSPGDSEVTLEINLIGIKYVSGSGIYLIHETARSRVGITFLDTNNTVVWTTDLPFRRPAGSVGQLVCMQGNRDVHLLALSDRIEYVRLNRLNGQLTGNGQLTTVPEQLNPSHFGLRGDTCIYVDRFAKGLQLYRIHEEKKALIPLGFIDTAGIAGIPIHFDHFSDSQILAYSIGATPDHSQILLRWLRYHMDGSQQSSRRSLLESRDMSFGFYGSDNAALFETSGTHNGFLAIGKLDRRFEGVYLQAPEQNGFFGFWIARYDSSGGLIHFKEYPFKDNKDLPYGLVKRDYFIDLKEDASGLFVNFTLLNGVLAADHIVYHLNGEGRVENSFAKSIPSGFFDYTPWGIRHISRSCGFRLYGDDWRYYSVNYLAYLEEKESLQKNPFLPMLRSMRGLPSFEHSSFNYFSTPNGHGVALHYQMLRKGNYLLRLSRF